MKVEFKYSIDLQPIFLARSPSETLDNKMCFGSIDFVLELQRVETP